MTEEQDVNKRKVELAFPKIEPESELVPRGGTGDGIVKHLSTSIDEISDWFKQFEVESIELSISGMMETGALTKLVLSARGEGGMRVMLKPKPQQ